MENNFSLSKSLTFFESLMEHKIYEDLETFFFNLQNNENNPITHWEPFPYDDSHVTFSRAFFTLRDTVDCETLVKFTEIMISDGYRLPKHYNIPHEN